MHLTGRTRSTLEDVANRAGRNDGIDICVNATFDDDIQGTPLVDMSIDDLMQPVAKAVTST